MKKLSAIRQDILNQTLSKTEAPVFTNSISIGYVGSTGYTLPGNTSGAASGDALTFNNSGTLQWTPPAGGSINSLTGVNISSPQTGEVLKYDGAYWVNSTDATGGGGAISLANGGVSDVSISAPAAGQVLTYDAGSWVNATPDAGNYNLISSPENSTFETFANKVYVVDGTGNIVGNLPSTQNLSAGAWVKFYKNGNTWNVSSNTFLIKTYNNVTTVATPTQSVTIVWDGSAWIELY